MTVRSCELDRGSACPPAGERSVDAFDLSRELSGDVGELRERAGDRAERDAFQRLAELGDGLIEAIPDLLRPASRAGSGTQFVGELHVASARMRTVRKTKLVGVTQRSRLLLGGLCDRSDSLRELQIGRRFDAGLQRVAPASVGELDLLDRNTRVCAHDSLPGMGPTVMMWSAICRGAGTRAGAYSPSRGELECPWVYAGDASSISARSTSDRRTLHSRPTRTARSRPFLIQIRTVAGWIFSSALTCGTVSHGSSPAGGVLGIASGIECVDGPRRRIYQLGEPERRRTHYGDILCGRTAASQMDDHSGKVIDGTARARHWRRSQTETRAEDRETEVRYDAPKSFAASLLVPADMLDAVPGDDAELSTAEPVSARHGRSENHGQGAVGASIDAPEHRNPFLMPEAEAAVVASAKRGFSGFHTHAVIARLIAWSDWLVRSVAGRHRARRSRLLAVVAASACAAIVTGFALNAGTHPGSTPTQSIPGTAAIASLNRLRGTSLHITLRRAQRSRTRPSKPRSHRVSRPHSHQTVVSRATAVATRYTPPLTRTGSAASTSSQTVEGGSTTSSAASSGAGTTASSAPAVASSRPTGTRHSTTQAFGASGALGPGSSPDR